MEKWRLNIVENLFNHLNLLLELFQVMIHYLKIFFPSTHPNSEFLDQQK